jgi:hypothetical protein
MKRMDKVDELKEKYACPLHSTDRAGTLHCWVPKKTNVHYALNDQDFRFWANDIVMSF